MSSKYIPKTHMSTQPRSETEFSMVKVFEQKQQERAVKAKVEEITKDKILNELIQQGLRERLLYGEATDRIKKEIYDRIKELKK